MSDCVRMEWRALFLLILVVLTAAGGCMEGGMESFKLTAPDGVAIDAGIAGDGPVGLVLGHGLKYTTGKDSFAREVEWFAKEGITALAISFRGYPADKIPPMQKDRDLDLLAAVSFLRERGCKSVYVLGSSMGGWVALQAAKELEKDPAFRGLVLISAGDPGAADDLAFPKLFVVAEDDPKVAAMVKEMHDTAAEPKKLELFETGGHGQALFESRREEVLGKIVAFMKDGE